MKYTDYFKFLVEKIHSVIVATKDENDLPVTCAIDIMDWDENGLYFLTAKGKNFYNRLKQQKYIALTGMKGEDTMSSVALSIRGNVAEIGVERLPILFQKNTYMYKIYPTAESITALTVFQIYAGSGEWFDLSKKPIERDSFTFGGTEAIQNGYFINAKCCNCQSCLKVCPQNCIDIVADKAVIRQKNCLHCGNCMQVCPVGAVKRRPAMKSQ